MVKKVNFKLYMFYHNKEELEVDYLMDIHRSEGKDIKKKRENPSGGNLKNI